MARLCKDSGISRSVMSMTSARAFGASNAYSVKSKFEAAYNSKMDEMSKFPPKYPDIENKAEYGTNYYNEDRLKNMKVGYVHPYHTEGSPLFFSNIYYMKNLFAAVGPEQVSPHYETLSRSRRGVLLFGLYIASINTVSRFGGWEHNDWLRAMVWHHEFLIAYYVGLIEIRHFTYFVGPKFTVFYNVYTNYEYNQLSNQWADSVEMVQNKHLAHTKEQLEYNRIDSEYESVKKRALINFLTNSKLEAEANFHARTVALLNNIQNYEQNNLKAQMREIAEGSVNKVMAMVESPEHAESIKRNSFLAALDGIRTGQMTYKGDSILPAIEEEMQSRLAKFRGLTREEEIEILGLTAEQRRTLADNDNKLKNEFLVRAPAI